MVYLLDSNVLIALATPDHTAHKRALLWFQPGKDFATCPITEGALVRFYLRMAERGSAGEAKSLLARITQLPGHVFWPDDAPYSDMPERGVIGHRQVTDAYLVCLAAKHGGVLATMDDSMALLHRSGVMHL
ncbi:MAG: TA system VapC family ribonuclease toxin [Bryobacteraceae bacterium]